MLAVACPSCGAEVMFRSPALPVKVCDYCRSLVLRIDDAVQDMGKAAVLPFDVSPVQIGMSGRWKEQSFEVIGRIRWGWSDGAWNEWLMLLADGNHAWLGEAMGQFMLQFEKPLKGATTRVLRKLIAGDTVVSGETGSIGGTQFQVADVREIRCISCEGELPFTAPSGWEALSVDFRSETGACATFQKDRHGPSLYVGRYVTLADLSPANVRPIAGWPIPDYAA